MFTKNSTTMSRARWVGHLSPDLADHFLCQIGKGKIPPPTTLKQKLVCGICLFGDTSV